MDASEEADKYRSYISAAGNSGYGVALPKIDIKKVTEIRSRSLVRGVQIGSQLSKLEKTPTSLVPSTNRNVGAVKDLSATPLGLAGSQLDQASDLQDISLMTRDNSTII